MHNHNSSYKGLLHFFISVIFLFSIELSNSYADKKQAVMGAGPSTVVAQLFFKYFSNLPVARGYDFTVVPRSIKHIGGLRASNQYLFGRTGRPLNKIEKNKNKHDLFIARIPISFVIGKKVGVSHITIDQLEKIFLRKITNWKMLGGADADIVLAGREPTEAVYSIIQRDLPFLQGTKFDLTLTRDHQLVNFLKSSKGNYAIGFGAQLNFDNDYLMQVDGFKSGVSLGLVYDSKNANHPVVKAAIDFAKSKVWHELVIKSGLLPPDM